MSSIAVNSVAPFRVWEKVELIVGEDEHAGHYLARILDFVDTGTIITEPEFLQGDTLLHDNATVNVLVTREDAVYQFHSSIKRIVSPAGTQFLLAPPRHIERVQRRLFVRVESHKQISYAQVLPLAEWQLPDDGTRWQATTTIDISGGGVLFRLNEELERHTFLLLKLEWFGELGLPYIVAALSQRCLRRRKEYWCGASFILADQLYRFFSQEELAGLPLSIQRFDSHMQNRLVAHIFQLQVALRRKGLLR